MPHINLLPWRETARQESQKQFISVLIALSIASAFLVFLLSLYFSDRVDGQHFRNDYLKSEIAILDRRIREIRTLNETKESLNQRIQLIEQLQSSRNMGTEILNEIAAVVPAGIFLTKIEKKNEKLSIMGKSESNNRLANMMRQIERSKLLGNAVLESIVAGEREHNLLSDFTMSIYVSDYIKTEAKK